MPIISFASSKGGVGKTTSAILLATELAEAYDVVVIDADPRKGVVKWARRSPDAERIRVVASQDDTTLQDEIDDAAAEVPFVLVDLEGSANMSVGHAMSASDLVLIPTREHQQDAQEALATVKQVERVERSVRRPIDTRVLLTQTKAAVKSRTARHVRSLLDDMTEVRLLGPELVERDAYAALHSFGGGLRQMSGKEVNGLDKAIQNAEAYRDAVLAVLRDAKDEGNDQ